jgi:PTS system N-acetylglucosamine-specific IIC component
LGEYTYTKEGMTLIANGDLHRFFAGDPSAGTYMAGFYPVMMFGLPSMALAIYLNTPQNARKQAGALLAGVAFTSFLTGITEPLEFLFLFAAPLLFGLHALLTGLALATAQLFNIHAGFGFSAGFIDYLINYKLAQKPLLLLPLGVVFGLLYFFSSYYLIKFFKLDIFAEATQERTTQATNEALTFIEALGGKENIIQTDACITRLRMSVQDSRTLLDEPFLALGAKGVIRPDNQSIQIILGTKAESVAEAIKEALTSSGS